jgi:hypothetical protein
MTLQGFVMGGMECVGMGTAKNEMQFDCNTLPTIPLESLSLPGHSPGGAHLQHFGGEKKMRKWAK